ncbi:hypothetical protein ACHWQZ_G008292 [Mnemiopsis leidyi]
MVDVLEGGDLKKWNCIYPAYINSNRSIKRGRRIPKEIAVENPTCQEIGDVVKSLGLRHEVQPRKHYTRELDRERWQLGRVKVQLLDSDGSPLHDTVKSKGELMEYVATMIPKLKSRSAKGPDQQQASSSGKNKKKKGKK